MANEPESGSDSGMKIPFIPAYGNLRIFILGLMWICLGGLGPVAYEIWDAEHYETIDWGHIRNAAAIGVFPAVAGYWRKYKALISPPPEH